MIDWLRVAELRDEIGGEDFEEVAALFLEEVTDAIAGLDEAGNNARAMETQVNALKGSALNLGFKALADIAYAGERAAATGDTRAVLPDEVRRVFEASVDDFQRNRAEKLAA